MKKTHLILGMLALATFMFTFTGCADLIGKMFPQEEPSITDLQKYLVQIDESDLTEDSDNIILSDGEWEISLEQTNSRHTYEIIYAKFQVQNSTITVLDGIDVWRDANLTSDDIFYWEKFNSYTISKEKHFSYTVYTGTKKDFADLTRFVINELGYISTEHKYTTKTNSSKNIYKSIYYRLENSTNHTDTYTLKQTADSSIFKEEEYNPDNYTNPVPEDAVAIYNPHDFTTFSLGSNFSFNYYGYVPAIIKDETYGKVLNFARKGYDYEGIAELQFEQPIDLTDKTLYMVIKGKSDIDNSNYTDIKVILKGQSGNSETYNFIPKDDTQYKTYSAANNQFWVAYNSSNAISDWSKIYSISFLLQAAQYDFSIAAIYCK